MDATTIMEIVQCAIGEKVKRILEGLTIKRGEGKGRDPEMAHLATGVVTLLMVVQTAKVIVTMA